MLSGCLRAVLLNNVKVPVSGPKLQHPGKQPCSSCFFFLCLSFSTHCHFPPKTHQLPYFTHTRIAVSSHNFARCVVWCDPSSFPSSLHLCLHFSLSLPCRCSSVLPFPFMQNYSPFPRNLWRNATNFPIVLLLKHCHNSLFPLKEKRHCSFFRQPVWYLWERTNITDSYREKEKHEKKKENVTAEGKPYLCVKFVCDYVCVKMVNSWGVIRVNHR